jgi:DNA mismatch endonuclease (patch repair protein)
MKLSAESRSRIMRAIRSQGNMSTEVRFASLLRGAHLTGWRRHQQLPGRPDFVFKAQRLAIFIDGCFWHACPRCSQEPHENQGYWGPKLARNRQRDRQVSAELRLAGWTVIRIWEHQLEKPLRVLQIVKRHLERKAACVDAS